jgi:hypothetical protein
MPDCHEASGARKNLHEHRCKYHCFSFERDTFCLRRADLGSTQTCRDHSRACCNQRDHGCACKLVEPPTPGFHSFCMRQDAECEQSSAGRYGADWDQRASISRSDLSQPIAGPTATQIASKKCGQFVGAGENPEFLGLDADPISSLLIKRHISRGFSKLVTYVKILLLRQMRELRLQNALSERRQLAIGDPLY